MISAVDCQLPRVTGNRLPLRALSHLELLNSELHVIVLLLRDDMGRRAESPDRGVPRGRRTGCIALPAPPVAALDLGGFRARQVETPGAVAAVPASPCSDLRRPGWRYRVGGSAAPASPGSPSAAGKAGCRGWHGLSCDNLVAARLVCAGGGQILPAGEHDHPEPLWGLRGGRGTSAW
jgi:hypothetical protein